MAGNNCLARALQRQAYHLANVGKIGYTVIVSLLELALLACFSKAHNSEHYDGKLQVNKDVNSH